MLSDLRDMKQALADLIERRNKDVLTRNQRTLIDRMIIDLEAEVRRRSKRKPSPLETDGRVLGA